MQQSKESRQIKQQSVYIKKQDFLFLQNGFLRLYLDIALYLDGIKLIRSKLNLVFINETVKSNINWEMLSRLSQP